MSISNLRFYRWDTEIPVGVSEERYLDRLCRLASLLHVRVHEGIVCFVTALPGITLIISSHAKMKITWEIRWCWEEKKKKKEEGRRDGEQGSNRTQPRCTDSLLFILIEWFVSSDYLIILPRAEMLNEGTNLINLWMLKSIICNISKLICCQYISLNAVFCGWGPWRV